MKQHMHKNSLEAYSQEEANLSKRAKKILTFLKQQPLALTDREIQKAMGYPERGMVQPRISEMIFAGLVIECGKKKCSITNKNVRLVEAAINDWRKRNPNYDKKRYQKMKLNEKMRRGAKEA